MDVVDDTAAFTPDSFLTEFVPLLRRHSAVHSVWLRLSDNESNRNNSQSHAPGPLEVPVTISVDLCDRPPPFQSALTASKCVVASYTVRGCSNQFTARWCALLQRLLCVASLLWSSAGLSECGYDDPLSEETQTPARAKEGEGAATLNQRRYLSELHILLFPLVPELHWVRQADGIFGSLRSLTVRHAVELCESDNTSSSSAREADLSSTFPAASLMPQQSTTQARSVCTESQPAPHGKGGDAVSTDTTVRVQRVPLTVGVVLNANLPLGPDGGQTPCVVVLHASGGALITDTTAPSQRSGEPREQSSNASKKITKGYSAGLFSFRRRFITQCVMPAVSPSIFGRTGTVSWRLQSSRNGDVASPTETSTAIVRECGPSPLPATASLLSLPPSCLADNVCGIAHLGTSYYVDRVTALSTAPTRCNGSSASAGPSLEAPRVQSVTMIVDLPERVWRQMEAESDPAVAAYCHQRNTPEAALDVVAAGARNSSVHRGEGSTRSRLMESTQLQVAIQIRKAFHHALRVLAARFIDAFGPLREEDCASAAAAAGPGAALAVASEGPSSASSQRANGGVALPHTLLTSVAESFVAVLRDSPHDVFVKEAEHLVRQMCQDEDEKAEEEENCAAELSSHVLSLRRLRPQARTGRASPAELHWAIESRLRRLSRNEA